MAVTRADLDLQSDRTLTQPILRTRMRCIDSGSTNSLYIDFDEPAGADRTVNFEDPGADDTVTYLNKLQVFQNKQITTAATNPNDIPNKNYVDGAISTALTDATAGSGGGVKGIVTFDSDQGLDVTAGVAKVKVDGVSIYINGFGEIEGGSAPPIATSAPGGGTLGKVTFDSDKGLSVTAGVAEVKVDGTTVSLNGSGQLEIPASAGISVRSEYLNDGSFGNISGVGISGDIEFFNATDFETYYKMSAAVGVGVIHLSFQGRLGTEQTVIREIRHFVKGAAPAGYTMKVYVEGTGLALTYAGPAPGGTPSEVVKTNVDLSSATPSGSKRFAVVFEVSFSGAGQNIYFSRPFVRVD